MDFITPSFLLFSIFLVAVLLFYLFRKQYESQVIPSTLLWQQVMQEWQATTWWKKLQNHLLLYLQLLILLLLMLALMRPYFGLNELSGEHIVVVLDTSASMTVEESENKSRFDMAKENVLELVDKLDDQQLTVVLAEEIPTILLANETAKQSMVSAMEEVEVSYQQADVVKAIQLANQLLVSTTGEIHVFSDTVHQEQIDASLLSSKLVVHNIGTSTNNVALHTFGVAQNQDGMDGILTVYNETSQERLATIRIESDGETLLLLEERIEPGKIVQIPLTNLPIRSYYRALLLTPDSYKADNELIAFLGENTPPSIHLIGDVNSFTTKALHYFSEHIVQYDQQTNVAQENTVFVLEGIPEDEWPNGPAIIFAPMENGTFQVKENELITGKVEQNKEDPLLHYVDWNEVYIQSSFPYDSSELETLVVSGDIPLISKGYYNGHPFVFVGFDIADTDWPLHASFPIFLYNAITYLNEKQETLGYVKPSEKVPVAHQAGATKSTVINEQGQEIVTINLDEASFTAPSLPGLYQLQEEMNDTQSVKLFAVTIDPEEKYIEPSSSFTMEAETSNNQSEERPNEIWLWLALIALLVLFVEWEVYRRGISN